MSVGVSEVLELGLLVVVFVGLKVVGDAEGLMFLVVDLVGVDVGNGAVADS